jgi:hypothetical protein
MGVREFMGPIVNEPPSLPEMAETALAFLAEQGMCIFDVLPPADGAASASAARAACATATEGPVNLLKRIDDLPAADFAELEAAFEGEGPVYSICTLEWSRNVMTEIVRESPRDEISADVRSKLAELLYYTTAALVTHRFDVESEGAVRN